MSRITLTFTIKNMGLIYKITSPTGRLYVGQTKHFGRRINTYKYKIINDTGWKNAKIMNSLKKYGWDAHKLEIIEECENCKLNEREVFWIEELKTYCYEHPRNMNMTRGGESGGTPWMHDIERRKKQSKAFTKEGNPFFGKTHSDEWRSKKSKEVSEYNKKTGKVIPEWGAEKGRDIVRTAVLCYDKNGEFKKEYKSLQRAADDLGINHSSISAVCNEKRTNVGGFVFRYKTENYPLKIDVGDIKYQTVRRPILRLTKDMMVLKEYPSAKEASEELRIPKTTINRAAQYNLLKPIRSGHIFIYKDLYAEIVKLVA